MSSNKPSGKKSLEDRVKGALIEAESAEFLAKVEDNRDSRNKFYGAVADINANVMLIMLEAVGEKKIRLTKPERRELLIDMSNSLRAAFETEEAKDKIRDMVYQKIAQFYETPEEARTRVCREAEQFAAQLAKEGADDYRSVIDVVREMAVSALSHPSQKQAVDYKQRKIQRLAEIAGRRGINYAVSRESRDEVIRELWPARKDYIAFMEQQFRDAKELIDALGDDLERRAGDAGEIIASTLRQTVKATKKIYSALGRYSEQDLDRIYGPDKRIVMAKKTIKRN